MKINFIVPSIGTAGGDRVIVTYAHHFLRRGHEVNIIAPQLQQPTILEQLKSLIKGKGFIERNYSMPTYYELLNVPFQLTHHTSPIYEEDVPDGDIVIATWWETAEWVSNFSQSKGAKIYFIQHYETVIDPSNESRIEATYRMPFHKVTISRWLKELMNQEYGDPDVSLIPNSVDTSLFYAEPRLKQSVPTVGFMYSRVLWKGSDICIQVIQAAKKLIPNLRTVAFGHSAPSEHLPLPKDVEFKCNPNQHEIRSIYASCDVWLFGSRKEGFGLPVLEAMACRCPVVSTTVGGPMDIIQNGINGYLVDVGDVESLATFLVHVLELPTQEWLRMSEAAYATAAQYTWDDATDLFEKVLYEVVEGSIK